MEVYLSDTFEILSKTGQPKRISFQYLKVVEDAYRQYCDLDIFKDVKTKIDLSFLMEVRHVIIHHGGVVSQKFMDNCSGNNKYDYRCFDSKYVTDLSKFHKGNEINFLFNDKMIETVHKDVISFIDDVHSITGL